MNPGESAVAFTGVSKSYGDFRAVEGLTFGINLIPHTLTVTTWGAKNPGDRVNLEVDVFARYVARLMEFRP